MTINAGGQLIQFNKDPNRGITASVDTKNTSVFSTTYKVDIPAIRTYQETQNGKVYTKLAVHGFSNMHEVGKPNLPSFNYFMVTPRDSKVNIKIVAEESQVLDNVLVSPALAERLDNEELEEFFPWDVEPAFETDITVYEANTFFPKAPARIIENAIFHGIPLSLIQICPVLHNPVTRQVKVFTSLTIEVECVGGVAQGATGSHFQTIIEALAVNGRSFFEAVKTRTPTDIFDEDDDYLIMTTGDYKDAAEDLAALKRMQGYDVKLVSKSSWSTSSISSEVEDFYKNNNKAEYFLIIGDHQDLPGYNNEGTYTDLNYAMIEGSDYYPEMARGRLPVETASQARIVVDKIIKYQRNPPDNKAFFNKMLGAAYFQDKNGDGEEDRRYSLTMEELINYMKGKNYDTERIYTCSRSVRPRIRNDGSYAFGQPVEDYLKKPNFPWDGGSSDIIKAFNKGTFVVMHRDHGSASGWAQPSFKSSHCSSLNNGDLLPLVFSLNCTTGKFSGNCFSEALIRRKGGGCVAVYGAANASPTGPNCALCHGLTDAFWPGTAIHRPSKPKPRPPVHDPIYPIGDAMNHGLMSVEKYWSKSIREWRLYQCFGDPAMELTTSNPVAITADHGTTVGTQDKEFVLKGLNVTQGIATLYNAAKKTLIGRVAIKKDEMVKIPVASSVAEGEKLTLYIWGHNFRPHEKEITVVNGSTAINGNNSGIIPTTFSVYPNNIVNVNAVRFVNVTFTAKDAKAFTCAVYDVLGNQVALLNNVTQKAQHTYTVGPWNLTNQEGSRIASGTYFIKGVVSFNNGQVQTFINKLGVID